MNCHIWPPLAATLLGLFTDVVGAIGNEAFNFLDSARLKITIRVLGKMLAAAAVDK